MQAFYQEMGNKRMPAEPNQQLDFPYPCTYISLHGLQCHGFSYVQRLTDFTFLAVADGPSAGSADHFSSAEPSSRDHGQHLFVKFCKR